MLLIASTLNTKPVPGDPHRGAAAGAEELHIEVLAVFADSFKDFVGDHLEEAS